MARKIYIIENLDCANCAAKIEAKINALPEVQEATITFATRQLRLTAQDPDALIPKLTEIARTVEGEVEIRPREEHHHEHHHEHHDECGCDHEHHDHGECCCGHEHHHHDEDCDCGHEHHHHDHDCGCGHHHEEHEHHHESSGDDKRDIILGASLFVVGLVLELLGLNIGAFIGFVAAYLVLGREVIVTAAKNLTKGHVLDENFLMSIATIGAFAIGEFAEAVGVMLFYRVGEYFEEKAVERSRSQIMEAVDLRPEVVNLVDGDEIDVIPAGEAKVGDVLLVRPGDRIPLDGVVVSGESRVDTAPITGEPVPVRVAEGDKVVSGCVNTTGQLTMRVEKPLSESMVTRILDSVENAAASKPQFERFITRFARVYTPIVVGLAAFVAIVPSIISGDWNYWVYTALSFLVMSCPCALVLSVPLAFFSGIGAGSKRGILFKGGVSIEAMGKVKAVVMDKTGTITRGDFRVREISGGDELLRLVASAEQNSTHPIGGSIVEAAKERKLQLAAPESLEEIPGHGIRAVIEGKTVLCGNEKLLAEHGVELPDDLNVGTGTRVFAAVEGQFAGFLVIDDTLKPGAKDAVARLKGKGIATAMLTGDGHETAKAIAAETGIDEVHAKLLPDEKLTRMQDIRSRYGAAMFVGDGINDAPVLAGADVGAAMGSGADAAIEAADVVFMTSDVDAIPESLEIARKTGNIAMQNVVFALTVKLIVMLLGLFGHASMWMAVFADSGVAMLCVLNSIRLLYKKK
ncbi:MAG: cadmium-translocating P-type ATPase [Oscillospiraceae bacterium]|nr:cadmium-translocating P-type ATPase [Oscillospiraceae bacterium]